MEKNKKRTVVENLKEEFGRANSVFVIHYQGLTVKEMENLRKEIYESAKIFVSKNTLTKIAVMGTEFEKISEFFSGPIALLFSADPVNSCKSLMKYSASNNKLKILGGVIEKSKVDSKDIKLIAKLPSLDVLRGQIVFLLSRIGSNLVTTLNANATSICRVIEEYSKKND